MTAKLTRIRADPSSDPCYKPIRVGSRPSSAENSTSAVKLQGTAALNFAQAWSNGLRPPSAESWGWEGGQWRGPDRDVAPRPSVRPSREPSLGISRNEAGPEAEDVLEDSDRDAGAPRSKATDPGSRAPRRRPYATGCRSPDRPSRRRPVQSGRGPLHRRGGRPSDGGPMRRRGPCQWRRRR